MAIQLVDAECLVNYVTLFKPSDRREASLNIDRYLDIWYALIVPTSTLM